VILLGRGSGSEGPRCTSCHAIKPCLKTRSQDGAGWGARGKCGRRRAAEGGSRPVIWLRVWPGEKTSSRWRRRRRTKQCRRINDHGERADAGREQSRNSKFIRGTINGTGPLLMPAERVGSETVYSRNRADGGRGANAARQLERASIEWQVFVRRSSPSWSRHVCDWSVGARKRAWSMRLWWSTPSTPCCDHRPALCVGESATPTPMAIWSAWGGGPRRGLFRVRGPGGSA